MPISPDAGADFSRELVAVYAEIEQDLLKVVSRRISQGLDSPSWYTDKLSAVSALKRELEKKLDGFSGRIGSAVSDGITKAYAHGEAAAAAEITSLGMVGRFAATSQRSVEAIVAETLDQVGSTRFAILRQTMDGYRDAVAAAGTKVAAGAITRLDGSDRVMAELARKGITGFVDSAGRNWSLESYAEMTMRTASGRAAVEGSLRRYSELGPDGDLVIVSDSPEECPLCRPWEGVVLSQSGRDRERPSLTSAISEGLFHPNCTHSLGLYVPGLTKDMRGTENPRGYDERQEQRHLERKVREWKRRENAALTPASRRAARDRRRRWSSKLDEFVTEKDRKRLRYRETPFRPKGSGTSGLGKPIPTPTVPNLGPRGQVLELPDGIRISQAADARKADVFGEVFDVLGAALRGVDEKLFDVSPALRDRFASVIESLQAFTFRKSSPIGRKNPITTVGTTQARVNRITREVDKGSIQMELEFARTEGISAYKQWETKALRITHGRNEWIDANPPPALSGVVDATVDQVEGTLFHEMVHAADFLADEGLARSVAADGILTRIRSVYQAGTGDPTFWYAAESPAEAVAELGRMYLYGTKSEIFPNGVDAVTWRETYPDLAEWVRTTLFGVN